HQSHPVLSQKSSRLITPVLVQMKGYNLLPSASADDRYPSVPNATTDDQTGWAPEAALRRPFPGLYLLKDDCCDIVLAGSILLDSRDNPFLRETANILFFPANHADSAKTFENDCYRSSNGDPYKAFYST